MSCYSFKKNFDLMIKYIWTYEIILFLLHFTNKWLRVGTNIIIPVAIFELQAIFMSTAITRVPWTPEVTFYWIRKCRPNPMSFHNLVGTINPIVSWGEFVESCELLYLVLSIFFYKQLLLRMCAPLLRNNKILKILLVINW